MKLSANQSNKRELLRRAGHIIGARSTQSLNIGRKQFGSYPVGLHLASVLSITDQVKAGRAEVVSRAEEPYGPFGGPLQALPHGGSKNSGQKNGKKGRKTDCAPLIGIRERLKTWHEEHDQAGLGGVPRSTLPLPHPQSTHNALVDGEENLEQQDYNVDEDEDIHFSRSTERDNDVDIGPEWAYQILNPGDLVVIPPASLDASEKLSIFLGHREKRALLYTLSGRWVITHPSIFRFSVPGFIPTSLINPILPYLPAEGSLASLSTNPNDVDIRIPQEYGYPLIQRMTTFSQESSAIYRKHTTVLDRVHEMLAHDTEVRYATLKDMAHQVYGTSRPYEKIGAPALYALHKALLGTGTGIGFQSDSRSHRSLCQSEIRPKEEVRLLRVVEHWLREYQANPTEHSVGPADTTAMAASPRASGSPMRRFLRRARELITKSRRMRDATRMGMTGPSQGTTHVRTDHRRIVQVDGGQPFTPMDQTIIRFFELWAGRQQFPPYLPINSLGSMILRATGMYDGHELTPRTGHLFLQEIGVYAPWEDRAIFSVRLGLQKPGLVLEANQHPGDARGVPDAKHLPDTMLHLRRDWKEMNVYCIDSFGAHAIDDGISIEPVSGPTLGCWLHIHIAHPTAFLPPSHALAEAAQEQTETVYFPGQVMPMFPEDYQWGLGPNRPALTFSVRLDEDGEIVERRVTPGIIRNVINLTPTTLAQVLDVAPQTALWIATVGGTLPQDEPGQHAGPNSLSTSQRNDLRRLATVALRLAARRKLDDYSFVWRPTCKLLVHVGRPQTDALTQDRRRPCFWEGDPIIQLRSPRWESVGQTLDAPMADVVVPELMTLAGETAAIWCAARGIPIPYRGTIELPMAEPTMILRPLPPTDADANLPGTSPMMALTGPPLASEWSSTPLPHRIVGLDMYAKATSPLRRFGDLLAHWQIDAALREEARTGRSLVGSTRTDYLPFSRPAIDAMLVPLRGGTKLISRLRAASNRTWLTQFLVRAVFFQQAVMPPTFACFVLSPPGLLGLRGWAMGYLKMLQTTVNFQPSAWFRDLDVQRFDEFEVEISDVNVQRRSIEVKPLRLIRRAVDQTPSELQRMITCT